MEKIWNFKSYKVSWVFFLHFWDRTYFAHKEAQRLQAKMKPAEFSKKDDY